jgi:hypothetical protein
MTAAVQGHGLYDKFRVERVDPAAQERHKDCKVFVLEPKHDPFARDALLAYAAACEDEHPQLAVDLRRWVAVGNISQPDWTEEV